MGRWYNPTSVPMVDNQCSITKKEEEEREE